MNEINFIKQTGYQIIRFPDGEVHLKLDELNRKEKVNITCRICNAEDLFIMMQLQDILKRNAMIVDAITIYYLMGARCDRLFSFEEPYTLGIVSNVINSFNANIVFILDPHNHDKASHEINNYMNVTNDALYKLNPNNVSVCYPDKGAKRRYSWLDADVVCEKIRDPKTGKIIHTHIDVINSVEGKDLVVVDDLCDGGSTFIGLAPELRKLNSKGLSLMVSHAVNEQGLLKVAEYYDKVYITDSYKDWDNISLPKNVIIYKVEDIFKKLL